MSFLTRFFLLTIVSTVSAIPSYSQESKTRQGSSAPAGRPPAVEHDPNAWKEYSSQRGLFTITFPGTPTDDDNSSGTAPRLEGRKYMLTTTAVYAVYYIDFPADFPHDLEKEGMLRKQWFDNARDGTVSQSKARVLDETDIAIDGHPGRLLKLVLPGGGILREKRFVVGKRVYQILVITPKESLAPDGGRFDESRATRFLDSFKLNKPAVAIEHNPKAWRVYSSTQGRFTIMFPGTPTTEDRSYDTLFGRCDARDYILTTFAEYRVSYTDFVVDLEQDSKERNDTLDHMRDRVLADFKAKVLSETVISLEGHPGRMMKLVTPDGSITRSKSYAVGKRLYQIMVTTSKALRAPDGDWFDESWSTKFFDSFNLAKPE